jgi:ATP adenylyltransferase
MDRIWSPWRYRFITEAAQHEGCVFCRLAADTEDDARNFILHRAERNFVILNLYPYTAGHMMVVPYEHVAQLESASAETAAEMMQLTRFAARALNEVYHPQGLNLGMNLGAAAGAGIAGHIHMHILPRWTGDANFLSTIGETRMLPEELPVTWAKLKERFAELGGGFVNSKR